MVFFLFFSYFLVYHKLWCSENMSTGWSLFFVWCSGIFLIILLSQLLVEDYNVSISSHPWFLRYSSCFLCIFCCTALLSKSWRGTRQEITTCEFRHSGNATVMTFCVLSPSLPAPPSAHPETLNLAATPPHTPAGQDTLKGKIWKKEVLPRG